VNLLTYSRQVNGPTRLLAPLCFYHTDPLPPLLLLPRPFPRRYQDNVVVKVSVAVQYFVIADKVYVVSCRYLFIHGWQDILDSLLMTEVSSE
jgi:hypothetical protein